MKTRPSITTFSIWLAASVAFLGPTIAIAASPTNSAPKQCPLTQVDRYSYYCNAKGLIQAPANLAMSKTSRLLDCAEKCEVNKACKSYRYTQSTSECQLFSKYLPYMNFDSNKTETPGIVSNRDCYTRDCNVIRSCAATAECRDPYYLITPVVYIDVVYQQYACNYGHTARTFGFNYTDYNLYKINTYEIYYSNAPPIIKHRYNLNTTCGAVQACLFAAFEDGSVGTMDLHWNIAQKRWNCRVFDDLVETDDKYYTYLQESVLPLRYTEKNTDVGMGFGFWKSKDIEIGY